MQSIIDNPRAALGAGLVLTAAAAPRVGLIAAGADGLALLGFLVRLVHVLAAMIWIGLMFFVNFVQLVVLRTADEPARAFLHKAVVPSVAWWFRHASTDGGGERRPPADPGRLPAAVARLRHQRLRAAGPGAAALGRRHRLRSPCGCSCTCTSGPACRWCWACAPATTRAKARARARVVLFARLNLVLSLPVVFAMVAAAHLY